jgi:hypothetical protein
MRVQIAGPVYVKRGDTVHIDVRLRKGSDYAFVAVFSSEGGSDPAPHIPPHKLELSGSKSGPGMLTPTTIRLTRHAKPNHKLVLRAEESTIFYLMQEVDVAADILAKGRIRKNGTGILAALAAYTSRWFHGDTQW